MRHVPISESETNLSAFTAAAKMPPHRLAVIAVELGLTVYDASYLELARSTGARLLTGDGPLGRAAITQQAEVLRP